MTDRALTEAERRELGEAYGFVVPKIPRLLAEHAALLAVARAAEYLFKTNLAELASRNLPREWSPESGLGVMERALAALPAGLLAATENGDG